VQRVVRNARKSALRQLARDASNSAPHCGSVTKRRNKTIARYALRYASVAETTHPASAH